MPIHYREGDDDSHIWRIETENDFRPSKRLRTALNERFEKYGIDGIASFNDWKASSEHEVSDNDASSAFESSFESGSETMALEEPCGDATVSDILKHYIRDNSDIEFLKEGLDKLFDLVGAKNHDVATTERFRAEMLGSGGHWMLTNLLAKLTQQSDDNNNSMSDRDDDEMVIPVVVRSCQILRELLLTNPSSIPSGSSDTVIRYQIYVAGGLDAVVWALKRFPTSFEVQLAGCQCLAKLVSSKGSNDGDNGSIQRRSTNPTITKLIENLYQSTDRLNLIVRLVGNGIRDENETGNSNFDFYLSTTQMWQLFFAVADIIRCVVWQSTPDSSCRAEMIQTVEACFSESGYQHTLNEDAMMMEQDLSAGCGNGFSGESLDRNGKGKYMYEYLMTILMNDGDSYENDESISSTYMNE